MLPSRYDPERGWNPMVSFRRDLDRLFQDFFGGGELAPMMDVSVPSATFDVNETPEGYELEAELPGIDPKDVKINVTGQTLTIEAESMQEEKEGRRRRRSERRFSRSLTLPQIIDPQKIEARLQNGILTITLPKSEQAKPRQIQVRSDVSGAASVKPALEAGAGQAAPAAGEEKKRKAG